MRLILIILFIFKSGVIGFPDSPDENRFDFIIVGGGTSGCVLANRLSEDGRYSVLLLEAGGAPPEFMNIPGLAKRNELVPELTFQYQTVPQKNAALGINGGVIRVSLGRVLGGTSQINYSIFNRGSPQDYNNWGNLTGDESWNYSNMLKYFKKVETYLGQFPSNTQHGSNGPIPVSFQHFAPGREAWLEAGQELGFDIKDPNGPQQISFTPMEFARRFGRRVSSYKGYLEPIMTRSNLRIVTNAYATKLLFDKSGNAAGVEYKADGLKTVFAKKEVILSSGAYGSATLLMRSGIGPRDVLKSAKIKLRKALPVGENLQEHPVVPIHIILNNKSLSYNPLTDLNPSTFQQYLKFGTGPYSAVVGYAGQAFLSSSVASKEGFKDWADIHLCMTSVTTLLPLFKDNFVAPWETSIIMNLYLGRQKSRGSVKLDPSNVDGMPLIDFNYLDDPRDELVFLDAVKATLKIFERTGTYGKLGARIFNEPLPACSYLPFRSEKYWRCYIRQTTIPGNHPAGTCSMSSVVDSKLRLIGIERLRVVDASIMPFITNTNLHAAVFGIAEKAADMILDENENKHINYDNVIG